MNPKSPQFSILIQLFLAVYITSKLDGPEFSTGGGGDQRLNSSFANAMQQLVSCIPQLLSMLVHHVQCITIHNHLVFLVLACIHLS